MGIKHIFEQVKKPTTGGQTPDTSVGGVKKPITGGQTPDTSTGGSGQSSTSGQSPNRRRAASTTNLKVTKKEGDYIYVNSETKDPYEYRYDNEMKHWQIKRTTNPNWITVKPSSGQVHKDADDSIRKKYDKIVNDYIAKNLSDSGQPPIATNTDNGVSSGGQTAGVSTGTESGVSGVSGVSTGTESGVSGVDTGSKTGANTSVTSPSSVSSDMKLKKKTMYTWDELNQE